MDNEWISVKDRLPEISQPVWLKENDRIYMGGRGDDGNGWLWCRIYDVPTWYDGAWHFSDFQSDEEYLPTHWHPLPMKTVRKEIAKHQAELDEQNSGRNGRYFTLNIDAPKGKVWYANDCHCLTASSVDLAYVMSAIINDMSRGLVDCSDSECEVCCED